MNVKTEMRIKTRLIDAATGKVVSDRPFEKNLVMDGGLNALARSTNATSPAQCFLGCRVGSGATSDKTSSGAVTFTQSTNQLTASASFFTSGMVGSLFKWGSGTGGVEMYITGFTSDVLVTVSNSATVAVPEVGVVWKVDRVALESLLYSSSTYETTAGSCQSTFSGATVTHKRTFNFAQQVASYNVNEVGYFSSISGTTIFGRLVLSATEVVNPTNFLQVVLELDVTYSPSGITAVADVGTNIDTRGNAMLENLVLVSGSIATVGANGLASPAASNSSIDGSASGLIKGVIADYTQNATIDTVATPVITSLLFQSNITWVYNSVRGQMRLSSTATISTAGQTLYGVAMCPSNSASIVFDVKFAGTYLLPTGSFLPQVTFLVTYDRNLSN